MGSEGVGGWESSEDEGDVRDDLVFVLGMLPRDGLGRFIAQVRRVARCVSSTVFRAWRARTEATNLRCGSLERLLGAAITEWKRGAATSRASTAHEKIAHLCLELEKQRENKLVLAKERKELQTLTQLLESERELKGARETEARAYTRILALLENTVQDVEALVTCSLAGLRRSSREELFGSHFATDNGPLLRQKGRSTNPFDDCEHGNDEPKAVAKMETIPEIQERSAELIRAPIKLESTTESDIGGNENLEGEKEQIECMHIESSWVQPMPVPVDLSPQYPSSHHSMRSFFSPENFSALSSLSDEDDDQHTRLMLSGERGQGDERSGICEDHRSSTAGTSAEAEKGRTAIIAKKGEQELQAEEGAACATDAEPAKQEGDEGTEKEGVGGLMQAIDVADVLEAQVASPVKRGARHNVFQEVFERRPYSPLIVALQEMEKPLLASPAAGALCGTWDIFPCDELLTSTERRPEVEDCEGRQRGMSVDAKERMCPMELGRNVETSTSEIDRANGSEVARGRGWRGKGLGRAGELSGTEQRSGKTERLRGGQRQPSVLPAAASTKASRLKHSYAAPARQRAQEERRLHQMAQEIANTMLSRGERARSVCASIVAKEARKISKGNPQVKTKTVLLSVDQGSEQSTLQIETLQRL